MIEEKTEEKTEEKKEEQPIAEKPKIPQTIPSEILPIGHRHAGTDELRVRTGSLEDDLGNQLTKVQKVDLTDTGETTLHTHPGQLSAVEKTDLTDAGATILHKHDHGGMDGLTDDDHPQYTKLNVDFDYTASATIAWSNDAAKSTTEATYAEVKAIILAEALPACRIHFEMNAEDSGNPVFGRIYKNGVAIGTERTTTSNSWVEYDQDFTNLAAGDRISIYGKVTTSDGKKCNIAALQLRFDKTINIFITHPTNWNNT